MIQRKSDNNELSHQPGAEDTENERLGANRAIEWTICIYDFSWFVPYYTAKILSKKTAQIVSRFAK